MLDHKNISPKGLRSALRSSRLTLAGNKRLKIYGQLHCKSGKRMKMENRVFFENQEEALANGYRPCGHCMRAKYLLWKQKGVPIT